LSNRKKNNQGIFFFILTLCAVLQHERKGEQEFVVVMAVEGDEIFNLSLTEKNICLNFHHAVGDCLSKI
jgi:hypothetical protein